MANKITEIMNGLLSNGLAINTNLEKKIKLLAGQNDKFKNDLTNKLKDILANITSFNNLNLQNISQTKNKLDQVTKELSDSNNKLTSVQEELTKVKGELTQAQNDLKTCTSKKLELENQLKQVNEKMTEASAEYQKNLANLKEEYTNKSNNEKKQLEADFNQKVVNLNNEKIAIQQQMEKAKKEQQDAITNLNNIQQQQESLIKNLGTINEFLAKQLQLIDSINTNQPNIDDYTQFLENIQNGISVVIQQINQAVNNSENLTPTPSPNSNNVNNTNPYILFDKFVRLSPQQQQEIFQQINNEDVEDDIKQALINQTDNDKRTISYLLNQYNGDLLKGGKRKNRKTRKCTSRRASQGRGRGRGRGKVSTYKGRGGYVYSGSKSLDKSSSVITDSSFTRNKRKYQSKHKSRQNK